MLDTGHTVGQDAALALPVVAMAGHDPDGGNTAGAARAFVAEKAAPVVRLTVSVLVTEGVAYGIVDGSTGAALTSAVSNGVAGALAPPGT